MSFEDNLRGIRERMTAACARAGRPAGDVTLVAVTKTFPVDAISSALGAGLCDIAESRIQEAQTKFSALFQPLAGVRKHLIGHLQTNKAKKAVELFDVIQSLDSYRLAAELDRQARQRGKVIDCLLEVKVSPEATKAGLNPDEVETLLGQIRPLSGIRVTGLMTMAPYLDDVQQTRPYFARARALFEKLQSQGLTTLSMGMSGDFEIAIEEGATMIRIGSALFGTRTQ
jgi:pyridoxal phosphate enzyme (YggS family)